MTVRAFVDRLHAISCSLRKITMILAELSVERFHGAVWNGVHRLADSTLDSPTRVVVDETSIKINSEWSWVNAAIDIDTKMILDVALLDRHGTDPAAAFLHRLTEKHDVSKASFLVDQLRYRTALARLGLSGRVDYADRNLMEKWFQTLRLKCELTASTIRVGSRTNVRQWFEQFVHYYNHQRQHQSLDGRASVEEVLNSTVPSG